MSDETFDRQRVCYEQNCETFRSLNNIMWQVPVIAMTLTGGLWYGVAGMDVSPAVQRALLLFSSVANVGLILVITRTRAVMSAYLKRIREFYPGAFADPVEGKFFWQKNESVRKTMSWLMGIGALISFLGFLLLPCIEH